MLFIMKVTVNDFSFAILSKLTELFHLLDVLKLYYGKHNNFLFIIHC